MHNIPITSLEKIENNDKTPENKDKLDENYLQILK